MTTPFTGEIQIFGFNFAPRDWAVCNGEMIPVQQNTALFSLLGTSFGGDGKLMFRLPNLAGRAVCSQGQGTGLSPRKLGEAFGGNGVVVGLAEMPQHAHAFTVYNQPDAARKTGSPSPGSALTSPGGVSAFVSGAAANAGFTSAMTGPAGGGQPHENRQPFLAMNYCIALRGIYPSFG